MTATITTHETCPECGRPANRCSECNKRFYSARGDAITCSDACRMMRSRRLRARKAKGLGVGA